MLSNRNVLLFSTSLFLFFCIQHFNINVQITEIKKEFTQIAKSSSKRTIMEENGGEIYYTLNYDGEIEEVLKKRNAFLKSKGFKIFGGWHIMTHPGNEISTDTTAFYVWCPI